MKVQISLFANVLSFGKRCVYLPNLSLIVKKLVNLYQFWRELQKNAQKIQSVFKQRRQEFVNNLDNLFDIAHADALQLIKIDEDRIFLQRQREPGRPGHLAGVDKKLAYKEGRARLRTIEEEKRRATYFSTSTPSTSSYQIACKLATSLS